MAQPDERAPAASWLGKVAWSSGPGLTRLRFHADRPIRPEVVRAAPTRLRVDLMGVGGGEVPSTLSVGTAELVSVARVPEAARGYLPPGVSERFLIVLAREDVAWNVETTQDGFVLLLGDEQLTGLPSPPAPRPAFAGLLSPSEGPREVLPQPGDLLDPPVPFRLGADLPLRAGPSAVHPEIGGVREGEVRLADARRGAWLHLRSGGWVHHVLHGFGSSPRGRGTSIAGRRLPMAWNVVTLVPVLNVQFEEVLPGHDAQADVVASYFDIPVRLARLTVLATGQSAFSFRFPPRADRLRLTLDDGSKVGSLDPMILPRSPGVSIDDLDEAFPSPQISTGEGFSGWLVFAGDLDFLRVSEARVDVAGRIHRLFRVPGSGELVEQ